MRMFFFCQTFKDVHVENEYFSLLLDILYLTLPKDDQREILPDV